MQRSFELGVLLWLPCFEHNITSSSTQTLHLLGVLTSAQLSYWALLACQWTPKQASTTWQDTEDCFVLHHVLLVGAFGNSLRSQVFSNGDAARQPKGALCLVPANHRNLLSANCGNSSNGVNNDVYCAAAVEPAIDIAIKSSPSANCSYVEPAHPHRSFKAKGASLAY